MRALLCMASQEVVQGLDAYSPNRMLHTGAALLESHNKQLLGAQGKAALTSDTAGGVNEDATECHTSGFGPATGHVVPQTERVEAFASAYGKASSKPLRKQQQQRPLMP